MKSRQKGSTNPENRLRNNSKQVNKATIYLTPELKTAIDEQGLQEDQSRSALISSIMHAVLLSPTGKQLREDANATNQELAAYLIENLLFYSEDISKESIVDLAQKTRRNPMQMIEFLIALGLKVYTSKTPADAELYFLRQDTNFASANESLTDEI